MEASSVLHQAMNSHSLDQVLATTCPKQQQLIHQPPPPPPRQPAEKRLRPQPEQALRCPRCDSTNTKFCYYNNYSLSQPRYFCKGCRRYWTQGGTLRNVPVGGGCRKNKRLSSTTSTCSSSYSPFSSSKRSPHDHQPTISTADVSSSTNPFLPIPPTPLALPFASFTTVGLKAPPSVDHDSDSNFLLSTIPTMSPCLLDILRGGSLENAYQSLCSTTGGEQVPLLPLGEVGSGGNGAAAVKQQEGCSRGGGGEDEGEGTGGLMMGLQWQVGGGEAGLVGLQKQQQLEPMEGGWEGPVEQRWA